MAETNSLSSRAASSQPAATAIVVRQVVWADWIFTGTTIIFQPLSGLYLLHLLQLPWTALWVVWTFALYALAGACWLLTTRSAGESLVIYCSDDRFSQSERVTYVRIAWNQSRTPTQDNRGETDDLEPT